MWNKTLKTKFKGNEVEVIVFLHDCDDNNNQVVRIQSMINEYWLIQDVKFEQRDHAHLFIQCFTTSYAKLFVEYEAYNVGAVQ